MKKSLILFALLALFDAIFGGSITALLQIGTWTDLDQRINNIYQCAYFVIIISSLIWLFYSLRKSFYVSAILVLFLGYVEDTLYYLLQIILKPVISWLTQGAVIEPPAGGAFGIFPDQVSGYLGWISRMFLSQNISISMELVFIVNAIAILLATFLFKLGRK